MGRSLWLAVFIACVVIAVAFSQSEVTADSTPSDDSLVPVPEPTDAKPPAGAANPHDPLSLHDPGRPQAQWGYDDMSPEEQAVIDRGLDTSAWAEAQKVYAASAAEKYPALAAQRAQLLMGVTDLAGAGVVP